MIITAQLEQLRRHRPAPLDALRLIYSALVRDRSRAAAIALSAVRRPGESSLRLELVDQLFATIVDAATSRVARILSAAIIVELAGGELPSCITAPLDGLLVKAGGYDDDALATALLPLLWQLGDRALVARNAGAMATAEWLDAATPVLRQSALSGVSSALCSRLSDDFGSDEFGR